MSLTGPVAELLDRVEAALAAVWAPAGPEAGEPAKVRAALINYVVVAPRSETARWEQAAEAITSTHPGRAIVVAVDGRISAGDVEAATTAVCRLDDGSTPVCSDRVTLVFGSLAAERTASFVRGLLLSELPTVVELAPGAPLGVARAMARLADRLVLDTRGTPLAVATELAEATRGAVADRAWVRGYSTRELIARLFDDAVEELPRITQLTVLRTAGGVDPAPLLVGWLATRLGWTPQGPGRVDGPRGPIRIELATATHAELPAGTLAGIHIDVDCDGTTARRSLERIGVAAARMRVEGPRACTHEHTLGFRDESWVADMAIDATEGDAVYRTALQAASQFVSAQTIGARS